MAKLLLDQNLPRSLTRRLQATFPGTAHLATYRMQSTADAEVFAFARANDFTIISKDADFHHLSFRFGAPPKVIWLRVGNASVSDLADLLRLQAFASDSSWKMTKLQCW